MASQIEDKGKTIGSRAARNTELYKEIGKTELGDFDVQSNTTIIGNSQNSIDVNKIKSILDTHYNELPRRKTVTITEETIVKTKPEPNLAENSMFETKEYDINAILDRAREDKVEDYEEVRSKKLHDTDYDILNNLNINKKDYIEDYEEDDNSESRELEDLINTITINEQEKKSKKVEAKENKKIVEPKKKVEPVNEVVDTLYDMESINDDMNPLNIFEDLKGDEDTTILDGFDERTQELDNLKEKTEKLIEKMEQTATLDDSFFTKATKFKKKDFENFEEYGENTSSKIIKFIIIVLVIIVVIGVIILVKSMI